MGNQLSVSGSAATINIADVSPSLTLMAPLGGTRRGRLFTSLHCGQALDGSSGGGAAPSGSGGTGGDVTNGGANSPANAAGTAGSGNTGNGGPRLEFVIKVFIKSSEDRLQAQLIAQHHEALLALEKKFVSGGSAARRGCAAAVPHALFYSEMDRRNDRFCKLQRPFVHASLAERLQMRPLCTEEQRLFFAYQLLEAVAELHDVYHVVHGDLKMENVLTTSHHWLYLVDFAPFKPAWLPSYNPANFEFYYDVSETRVCCAAPEKFFDHPSSIAGSAPIAVNRQLQEDAQSMVSSVPGLSVAAESVTSKASSGVAPLPPLQSPTSAAGQQQPLLSAHGHTSAMDVFSAACVMAQIMTDEPLFRLSGVLELRAKPNFEEKSNFVRLLLVDRGVVSEPLIQLLIQALCTPADQRPSARQLIDLATPSVFPPCFGFLHTNVLPAVLRSSPDVQVLLLYSRWKHIMLAVERCEEDETYRRCMSRSADAWSSTVDITSPAEPPRDQQHDKNLASGSSTSNCSVASRKRRARRAAVAILLPVLSSAMRHLKTAEARCQAMALFRECIPDAPPGMIRDIIIPYIVHVLKRPSHSTAVVSPSTSGLVRAEALATLRVVCAYASSVFQPSEALVFDDYIFPVISEVAKDTNVLVLTALANHLPHILLAAQRFLLWRQALYSAAMSTGGGGGTSSSGSTGGGLGLGMFSTFDSQMHALVSFGWDILKSLYKVRSAAVAMSMLRQTETVIKILGEERAQDELIPLLTTTMGSRTDVKSVLLREAIRCHRFLQGPKMKTLHFFIEEGLRQTDVACVLHSIEALQELVATNHEGLLGVVVGVVGSSPSSYPKLAPNVLTDLILRAISHMANPAEWVSRAACRLVECAARTLKPADIMMQLECAIRPFLTHSVPLALLSQFPNALKSELSWVHASSSDGNGGGGGGRDDANNNNAAGSSFDWIGGPQLKVPGGVSTYAGSDLLMDLHHVDVAEPSLFTTSTKELKSSPASVQVVAADREVRDGVPWQMSFFPSERHLKRWIHRSVWERSCGEAIQQVIKNRSAAKAASTVNVQTADASNKNSAAPSVAGTTAGDTKPNSPSVQTSSLPSTRHTAVISFSATGNVASMQPTAAALFSANEHQAPIYCMDSIGGLLVTGGANGIIKSWEISADDYAPSNHVVSSTHRALAPAHDTILIAQFLSSSPPQSALTGGGGGASPSHSTTTSLLIGGTAGIARLCDVECGTVVQECLFTSGDGASASAALTSSTRLLHHALAFVSRADGRLSVLDTRCPSADVWNHTVPSRLGPALRVTAIGPTDALGNPVNMQHAAVVATMSGHVLLFDLRYRAEVARHAVNTQALKSSATPGSPTAAPTILTMSLDVPHQPLMSAQHQDPNATRDGSGSNAGGGINSLSPSSSGKNSVHGSPFVFLGTRSHGILRLDLTNGNVVTTFKTHQSTETRTLLSVPKSGLLISGSSDRLIRLWNVGNPTHSMTLSCNQSESAKYGVSGCGTIEESVPPSVGFGPRNHHVTRKANSLLQAHLEMSSSSRQHHADDVTALHALTLRTSQYLASASRDGTLTVWHNKGS